MPVELYQDLLVCEELYHSRNSVQAKTTLHEIQLQDTSIVEIDFVSEFEQRGKHTNLSSTNVFLDYHNYELFLLSLRLIHLPTISITL